jgi:hypothetical protein
MHHPTKTVVLGVLAAAVLNYLLAGFLGDVVFNLGRAIIAALAGWFIVALAGRGLWAAIGMGPLVLLVDHVALKGGYFLLAHFFFPTAVEGEGLLAAAGVLISFVMFAPIEALFSLVGGFLAKRRTANA